MEQLEVLFELFKNTGTNKKNSKELHVDTVYKQSYTEFEQTRLLMIKNVGKKRLLALGEGDFYNELHSESIHGGVKVCPLSHENRLVLNKYLDYTVPQSFGKNTTTIGLGDRLGVASPGHIQSIKDHNIKPILAQQSIRELTLTNRSMSDIIDAASFAVFQEGYTGGFGADGDHLKKESDIQHALTIGMSMLTLDCSDYINNSILEYSPKLIYEEYNKLPEKKKKYYNKYYLNKSFNANGITITFDEKKLMKSVLLYDQAIEYMIHVYKEYIDKSERKIDFEISIDETDSITSPADHFFIANELKLKNIEVTSIAPRFCGEFQKGIDYIGDLKQFEKEFEEHSLIANHFDYKISIHSGSDKFSVFPIIGKLTNGLFHIKTAGTNWLEAIKIISKVNPVLYRKMHVFALNNFNTAKKYYNVSPDLNSIPLLENVTDNNLDSYMEHDATRQLFHITFGLILTEKNKEDDFKFRDEIFNTLNEYENKYQNGLATHIGKHIDLLGL